MKHGPRCEGCRVSMLREGNEFVCPECGYGEPVVLVAADLTARVPEPFDPKAMFEKLRRATE